MNTRAIIAAIGAALALSACATAGASTHPGASPSSTARQPNASAVRYVFIVMPADAAWVQVRTDTEAAPTSAQMLTDTSFTADMKTWSDAVKVEDAQLLALEVPAAVRADIVAMTKAQDALVSAMFEYGAHGRGDRLKAVIAAWTAAQTKLTNDMTKLAGP